MRLLSKRLMRVGFMMACIASVTEAMQKQSDRGFFANLYHRWKTRADIDFMFYVFPVAQDEQGNFWILGYEKDGASQPFFMPIEYRSHEPRIFRKSESGTIEYFQGAKYAKMNDSTRVDIAKKFIKDKTKGCFKKGAGLNIDDSWVWGKLFGYMKYATYRDYGKNDISVYFKATYKSLNNCATGDGQALVWIPIREESLKKLAKESMLQGWKKIFADHWFSMTRSSIVERDTSTSFKFKNYIPGAKEKLFGSPRYWSLKRA